MTNLFWDKIHSGDSQYILWGLVEGFGGINNANLFLKARENIP